MSTTVEVRQPGGQTEGSVELPAALFDIDPSVPLIHQVVTAQLAAARAGTHAAKTRGQVRGGGAKPYKQKGTGRARQGSTRAPQFAGGGTVHGPQPRSYVQRLPRKMRQAALRQILSDRARNNRIGVVSALRTGDAPTTREALATLGDWLDEGRILVVLSRAEELDWKSIRNVSQIAVINVDQLNTYDVVVSDRVVFSTEALSTFIAGSDGGQDADS